jgi:hypothetical protein
MYSFFCYVTADLKTELNILTLIAFINYAKAFNTVHLNKLCEIKKENRFPGLQEPCKQIPQHKEKVREREAKPR